jgi:F0F1-type ATP synthase gamma subunit
MNENFELNKIINQIVEIDLKTINGIKNYGYVLAPELINQIDQIKTVNSTHEIVKIFDEVMDVLQTEQQPELVIFFDQFKIRYTYLDTIKQALDASVTNYQQETGKTLT